MDVSEITKVVPSSDRLEAALVRLTMKAAKHREDYPQHRGDCSKNPMPLDYVAKLLHEELKGDIRG